MTFSTRAFLSFGIGWLLSVVAFGVLMADEPQKKDQAAGDKNDEQILLTADECKLLIEELASKREPPFPESVHPGTLPHGIREGDLIRVQNPIRKAYAALSDNIEVALPLLVEHADDKRFSYVCESISGAYVKASVGSSCRSLVHHHVEIYAPHVRSFGGSGIPGQPPYPRKPAFINDSGGIEKWWRSRKEKSLAELQVEAVEWAIRVERQKAFSTPQEEERIISPLEKQAERIRTDSKPILKKPAELFFFGK